jgi:steroid 5-alpha reductase family enzyme
MDKPTFDLLVWLWTVVALVVFLVLMFVTAPYGRHSNKNWGVTIPDRIGWFIMEVPALIIFLYFIITGTAQKTVTIWIVAALYVAHYINRAVIFPWRIRVRGKQMPLAIALMAVFFNFVNAGFLGYYAGSLHTHFTINWLKDPRFIAGLIIFITGMVINISSDEKLIHLRKKKNGDYQIPRGGYFEKVSCPNFYGEIIEWGGYAVLCWSLPAFSFFIWTFCNLVPRALAHHKWYKSHFADYPAERKAVFPYIL